jgi:hypothetical protein
MFILDNCYILSFFVILVWFGGVDGCGCRFGAAVPLGGGGGTTAWVGGCGTTACHFDPPLSFCPTLTWHEVA